ESGPCSRALDGDRRDSAVRREGAQAAVGAVRVVEPHLTLLNAKEREGQVVLGLDDLDGEVARGRGHARVVEQYARRHVIDLSVLDAVEDLRQIARRSP